MEIQQLSKSFMKEAANFYTFFWSFLMEPLL